MKRYLVRRAGQAVVVLILIACINFLILKLAPGDLVDVLAGESGVGDPQYLQSLREQYGLDQPLYAQLLQYLANLVQFNLGYSFRFNLPVRDLIFMRLPATLLLMFTSLTIAFLGGIAFGVAAARAPRSIRDSLISTAAMLAYSTPLFWAGLMLIVLFSVKLGILPSGGMQTVGGPKDLFSIVIDVARHLVLPSITLALFYMATYTRLMRASMLDIYSMDFVRTAKAKGLSSLSVAYRHVVPNSILPLISLFGVQLGSVFGGSVVVEVVFGWPGLGTLAFDALFQRDINLLMGILFLSSVMVIVVNLAIDLLYSWLDPRIEVEA
ncbi:ABC transporter permease [Afipia sp. Root123D2]|uniref:ABC transporter permease n=1 Tax=Afipia sp. Root123D2 TaxID=1736436 RepID=UPI0006F2A638|nr:ABC transporter permease [Afipia sp. Root123D2]KQW20919.1 ABC transporter permease [Afipia sp. Root123D2]